MTVHEAEQTNLAKLRDLIKNFETQTERGAYSKPLSAMYDAATNAQLLALARDGLRFRLIKMEALSDDVGPSPLKSESFLGEIDRRLAAL